MSDFVYLPYKAVNVFIEQEDLEDLLQEVLEGKNKLSKEFQISFDKIYKHHVSVLGFRNTLRAPLPLQVKAFATAFEEQDEIVPITLTAWTKLNKSFAENVKEWLESEGWTDLSLERTFNEDEGFSPQWPEDVSIDDLKKKYQKEFPKSDFKKNDFMLMVMWISGKLPPNQSVI